MGGRVRVALLLALALAAVACGGDDTGSGAGTGDPGAPEGEPVRGGSLAYGYFYEPTSLDVTAVREYFNNAGDGGWGLAIYDALFVADPVTGEISPRIAESLDSEDGGATYTLALRDGVEFSDGTPYDAEAVRFNWERLQDPASNAPTSSFATMMSAFEVVDPLHLRFTVTPASPQFVQVVARYLAGVGSPTAIRERGADFAERPVGAGPFAVERWVRDSNIDLVRNEGYWQDGLPYLDELTLQLVPDEQQRLQALVTGQLDMAQTANAQTIAQAEDAGLDDYVWVTAGGRWLGLNANRPPFDDPLAVDALRVAIDRDAYIQIAEGERGVAADSFLRDDHPLFDESGRFPAYDPDRAQELLDRYADETGEPLTFTLMVVDAIRSVGETLQSQLSTYENINVELDVIPTADNVPRLLSGDWEAGILAANFVDPFPEVHERFTSGNARNFSLVANTDLDAALADAAGAEDEAGRKEAYARVQRIIAEELPMVMLSRAQNAVLYDADRVKGLEYFNDDIPAWEKVWVPS